MMLAFPQSIFRTLLILVCCLILGPHITNCEDESLHDVEASNEPQISKKDFASDEANTIEDILAQTNSNFIHSKGLTFISN